MAVYQCPLCELKFAFRSEVETHMATDHRRVKQPATADNGEDSGVDAVAAEDLRPATAAASR